MIKQTYRIISIVLIFISMFGNAQADELRFLFPESKSRITYAPSGLFKLLLTSDGKRHVYLLQSDSISLSIPIATEPEREDFPKVIYEAFREDFAISNIDLVIFEENNNADTLGFNFSTTRPLDLKDFWRTTDFRRVLQRINTTNGNKVDIKMYGWKFKHWVVNSSGQAGRIDMIGSSVLLTPGENNYAIQIRSSEYELLQTDTLSFYYYFSYLADSPPDMFDRFDFHVDEMQVRCLDCHQEIEEDDCSFCHASTIEQEFTHEPAEDMDCTACHDESESPKYEIMEDFREDPEACLMCHGDIEEVIGEVENLHAPLDESCMICHDPHAGPNPFMVPVRTKDLCMACHEDIEEGFHPETNHPLEADQDPRREDRRFNCASCHDPHGSDEDYLLRLDYQTLCSECHMKN